MIMHFNNHLLRYVNVICAVQHALPLPLCGCQCAHLLEFREDKQPFSAGGKHINSATKKCSFRANSAIIYETFLSQLAIIIVQLVTDSEFGIVFFSFFTIMVKPKRSTNMPLVLASILDIQSIASHKKKFCRSFGVNLDLEECDQYDAKNEAVPGRVY